MRVVAGSAKGHILKSPAGSDTRPITDRVKRALFDILGPSVEGTRFLDLFAGTGSVGIEALSRGADHATFVERDRHAVRIIRDNLVITGLTDRANVVRKDVFLFLGGSAGRFDIIYIAPPQYRGLWSATLQSLETISHLNPGGLVIVQMFPKEFTPLDLTNLKLEDQRRYGSTFLCFYQSTVLSSQD